MEKETLWETQRTVMVTKTKNANKKWIQEKKIEQKGKKSYQENKDDENEGKNCRKVVEMEASQRRSDI